MLDLVCFHISLLQIFLIASYNQDTFRRFNQLLHKMRNDDKKMDVYTTLFCGCLLVTGGLIAFVTSVYGCFTLVNGVFGVTEVVISGCVVIFGLYLMARSLPKLVDMMAAKNDCEAPFYYELEPIQQRRDLPPIPKDIGRDYDPVILDRV